MRQCIALDTLKIVGSVEPRKLALDKLMNQRTQPLRLIEGANSDREVSSIPGQRMSLGKILAIQSSPALSAKVTAPGRRSSIDGRLANSQPERIACNSRSYKHRSAAAPPALIAVAIDNIEDPINFVSNRPAKTSAHEWPVNHVRRF
jgi:hypothetical protein